MDVDFENKLKYINKNDILICYLFIDQTLCCVCIGRKSRWNKVDLSKEDTLMNNKDNFMKGDNPFNAASDIMAVSIINCKELKYL